jgi:hypothetical protein
VKPPPLRTFPGTDSVAAPTENLGIRRPHHKRVHPGDRHPAHIRCIRGPGAQNATSCIEKGIASEPRGEVLAFQPGSGKCEVVVMARLESPLKEENGLE